jgi:uncharacterized RDD family membrane protein YckC
MATSSTAARAGFGERLVAAIIDSVLIGVVSFVFGIVGPAGRLLGFLVGLAYYIYLEGSPSGQTIGKRVMNIRIIDAENSGPIGFGRAAIRYFAKILSAIPCALGFFWMLWDDNKQTWHDKLSTDVVVPTSAYPVEAWPG